MKRFNGEDLLINNNVGQLLYERYAKDMPIFDYHTHLDPQEIYEDKKFDNITELWLGHDHYKWRAMRAAGVDEKYITGNASPREKFIKFAKVVERLIGCPLYYWVHLELHRYFDIDEPLCSRNAGSIYDKCNILLKTDAFSARALILRSKVKAVCTTDDPASDLKYHQLFNKEKPAFKLLPSFRPDRFFNINDENFVEAIGELEKSENIKIENLDSLWTALQSSLKRFKAAGCVAADHGLEILRFAPFDEEKAKKTLWKKFTGRDLTQEEIAIYQTYLIAKLANLYEEDGIVMQLHIGAIRNNRTKMFKTLGRDCGGDSVGASQSVENLGHLLDTIDEKFILPKTIVYPINPADYTSFSTMVINFNCGKAPYYVQLGNAWWFNDSVRGIKTQLTELIETGGLSGFVGMLTDSRSLTSFTRHEFFRRILCDVLGAYVEAGEYPYEIEILGDLVRDICYNNAVNYFEISEN